MISRGDLESRTGSAAISATMRSMFALRSATAAADRSRDRKAPKGVFTARAQTSNACRTASSTDMRRAAARRAAKASVSLESVIMSQI